MSVQNIDGQHSNLSSCAKGRYMQMLLRDFHALELLINESRLEKGIRRIGSELELNFLDRDFEPAAIGMEVCNEMKYKYFTTEFSRFNLEVNSDPLLLIKDCFASLTDGLETALKLLRQAAARHDASVLLTGIIPTLNESHITPEALTPEPRYEELYRKRRALKGDGYEYRIHGIDELLTRNNISLFAGCVTSFQPHLQLDADFLVDYYNWAQLLSGPVLSCATNSPLFLGKRLWHETRIALFEQATDTRNLETDISRNRPRVFFGNRWLQDSALEILKEDIVGFSTLFTLEEAEDPLQVIEAGHAPRLEAWSQFNGSIYRWNRLCYGIVDGKSSLRIENRYLPSGPTVSDMVANMVFWVGAMVGLPDHYRDLQNKLSFDEVRQNFFKAARLGLDVNFTWLENRSVSARDLILDELIPICREGLAKAGLSSADYSPYLEIICERVQTGRTGSSWMLDSYNRLLEGAKRDEALVVLTAGMLQRQESGKPVHTWEPVTLDEGGNLKRRYNQVHKFMTTELIKVGVDDVVDLAAHIMEWKRIGHIPVEDNNGSLVGIITKDAIINFMVNSRDRSETISIGDLMITDPLTVNPVTSLADAINLLLQNKVSCLPVLSDGKIVGIVTERDIVEVARELVQERSGKASHVNVG